MPVPPAVAIDGLVTRDDDGHAVVDGINLTAHRAAVTVVLGPDGAGKTTIIECCEGRRGPDAGTVRVLGLDPRQDAEELRPRIGTVLRGDDLPAEVPAGDVLRRAAARSADPLPLAALTERLGLGPFSRTSVRRLSGGQRQRLALACAVVGRPEAVLLDEPSAGMDDPTRRTVGELIRDLRQEGVGVLLATSLMEEAEDLADRVYILNRGRVIASGGVGDLLMASAGLITVEAAPALDTTSLGAMLGGAWTIDARGGTYRLIGPVSPRTLVLVADWLAGWGIVASSITTGRRTLQDYFLHLTGRLPRSS